MPSFSIEAEGEAAPLSAQEIFKILLSASDSGASQQSLQVASQQLSNWERTPGYYSLLQDVYSDFTLPDEARFQAIIQLKNGIDKYWRKTSTNAISKTEKQKIRSQAVEVGVREPKQPLALQNALMLAKIVRYEFPHDWPDVISTIIQHLRSVDNSQVEPAYVSNILNITLQIIKELASGRLQRTKKSLESVAPELLNVLGQLYANLVQQWSSSSSSSDRTQVMINSHSALKTLRRLLIAGFEHPHRDNLVKQFWDLLQKHQAQVWSLWSQSGRSKANLDTNLLMKHLFQYAKLFLEMARAHPASFVSLGCMDILHRSWTIISGADAKATLAGGLDWSVHRNGDEPDEESPIEKLALKALLLFRACVKMVFSPALTFKYQQPQDKEDKKVAVDQIRSTVFTDDFVIQLMEILVTQYFVLRPQDLREWEEEPDEWEKREEEIADAWEFSIRSCSEKLFLDLVINFKEMLVPKLLQVFQQYATLENQDVLLKDSLYSAIGIAAACVEDVFDFNTLLRTVLVPEVQLEQPHYNLIRRRIAILLGQWTPIKPQLLDRHAIYQVFAFLLSPEHKLNDHVVRVTAGRQLRMVLEPFEFEYAEFEPYATPILSNLMSLIAETELSETKMALLETVRVAVTKLEGKIEPYAEAIMSILPTLWTESGEEHLMKQAILTMITAIVTSLGERGYSFHEPILSLIHDSVQIDSDAIVYLLEEALDLWQAILQQTPTFDPPPSAKLLALVSDLLPLLETGSEHLRQCFEIIESYTVLSPTSILNPSILSPMLSSMVAFFDISTSGRGRDATLAPRVVENLVATISAPLHFPDQPTKDEATRHLISTMLSTGYLATLLNTLKNAYDYHQDPRPNRQPPSVIGVAETSLFTLLSRISLLSPTLFLQAIQAAAAAATADQTSPSSWLISEWLSNFDSIGDTIRKKLQTLGLTNLFLSSNPPPPIMLENLQSLLSVWTDIIIELADGAADENSGDYLWSGTGTGTTSNEGKTEHGSGSGSGPTLPDWPGEPPEDARKRAVTNNDPTYVINVRVFVAERLREVIDQCGGPEAFERDWLSRVDSVVVKTFADLKLL